jgi:XTP/dITP diphosphohydrolase
MRDLDLATLVVATRNSGKLREFRTLLAPLHSRILSLADLDIEADLQETADSFEENARLKAIECSRRTSFPVLADDSGLEVEALGGRPGVHSARYAGEEASDADRIRKLLHEVEKRGGGREARFVCALALARQGELICESLGICRGILAASPRGTNGFGYDPVFLLPELGKTFAELGESEKNLYSHRARAVSSLLASLK